MVGYKIEDDMSPHQKIIAGCISGVLTRFITQPLDVLKIRTQLERRKRRQRTLMETSRKIMSEEGVLAFWHGHNLGQMHSILSTTSQFYVYELATRYAFQSSTDPKHKNALEFLCGICAGSCSATLVTPLEVIRVRQMIVQEQYRGIFNGARAVYKSGGFFAFYEGWAAGVLMLGPQVGITFCVFGFMQPVLLNSLEARAESPDSSKTTHTAEHLLLASSISAFVAGFVAKVAMYPFDLAKRRLQIASHKTEDKFYTPTTSRNLVKCTNLFQCIRDTVKIEGFFGLYRGLQVTLYKALSTNILTFTTYELCCYFIRDLWKR